MLTLASRLRLRLMQLLRQLERCLLLEKVRMNLLLKNKWMFCSNLDEYK
jgi:hypothetical protein